MAFTSTSNYFEQVLMLMPVCIGFKVYFWAVGIKMNFLPDEGTGEGIFHQISRPDRPCLQPLGSAKVIHRIGLFRIVNVYIPVVIVHRLIFINLKHVPSTLQHLAGIPLVKERMEYPAFAHLDAVEWGFYSVILYYKWAGCFDSLVSALYTFKPFAGSCFA